MSRSFMRTFAHLTPIKAACTVAALALVAGAGATQAYVHRADAGASQVASGSVTSTGPAARFVLADQRRLPTSASEGATFVALDVALSGLPSVGHR